MSCTSARFVLRLIVKGVDSGVFPLGDQEAVGRGLAAWADIRVDEPLASGGKHFLIQRHSTTGRHDLVDLGHPNRIRLNRRDVADQARVALNPGDEITLGETTFRYEERAEPVPAPGSVPFEQRYSLLARAWHDGPYGGMFGIDRLTGGRVLVNMPYDDPASYQPFLAMARTRFHLCHPHLVPVYDLGTLQDGKPYFTEPRIESPDLGRLQRQAAEAGLPWLICCLRDACGAVSYLHARGFLHLELTPNHVLVDASSNAVFLSGGRPSRLAGPAGAREPIVGSPAYMAPEQADPAERGALTRRTDVYGLGGILFSLLYDRPPNGGGSHPAAVFAALLARSGPPPPGSPGVQAARSPELARALEPVCQRALQADPRKRYSSAAAFAEAIAAALALAGSHAH